MNSQIKNRLFCAALLLSSLQFGLAQTTAPIFYFGPPAAPVWDISGTYVITNHVQSSTIQPMDIVYQGLNINVNARGRLEGYGTIVVLVGDNAAGNSVGGDYRVAGSISGGGAKTRVNLSIHFRGSGTVAGLFTTLTVNSTYNLVVNPTNLTLVGTVSGSAHFAYIGSANLKSDISLPLPANVDGGWNVTVYELPYGNRLSGTAVVQVDSNVQVDTDDGNDSDPNEPAVLATKLTGTISTSGVHRERLSGWGQSSGTLLNLTYTPIAGQSPVGATVSGKVLGQNVKN